MFLSFTYILLAAWVTLSRALPNPQVEASATDGISIVIEPLAKTTISLAGQPSNAANRPDFSTFGVPVEASSYFWIKEEYYSNTKNNRFANRGKFYEQAFKDATHIADEAQKWPQFGVDASTLYFGPGAESAEFAPDIIANVKAAANWNHPRPVGCYVKNTRIVDLVFDGSTGKRIYGPEDVAKAARIYRPRVTRFNADSYAQFASAVFWKDIFGEIPQPKTNQIPPDNWTQLITDNDLNYLHEELLNPIPVCAGTSSTNPSVLHPYAQANILTFCSYYTSQNLTVNSGPTKYNPIGYVAGDSQPQSDNYLWLSVSFDPACDSNTTYTINIDECNFDMGTALNGCNTDTTSAKYGGSVEASYAIWNMATRFGHNDEPPNGFP